MSWANSNKYRDPELGGKLLNRIRDLAAEAAGRLGRPLNLMEVCGTHTMAMARLDLRSLLGENLRILSGPGCPVCVTDQRDIDRMLALAAQPGVIVTTFGDLIRVPGTDSTLLEEKAHGRDIRVVYSPLDSVEFAAAHPNRSVVFLGIGFETTAPVVAVAVEQALRRGLTNFSVFSELKLALPGIEAVISDPELALDGLVLPGHVGVVVGEKAFTFISERCKLPAVIAGFEPVDILCALAALLKDILAGKTRVVNQYRRVVRKDGNPTAIARINKFFRKKDAVWRGLGMLPATGLALKQKFSGLDAEQRFELTIEETRPPKGCRCGDILRGRATPFECHLFGSNCTPARPVGPGMVSSEGACAAYYQNRGEQIGAR